MLRFRTTQRLGPADAAGGWIYLGKDAQARERSTSSLGRPPLPLKGLLHEDARRLRTPYLDLIAREGAPLGKDPRWWAGTLSWKFPAVSDLLLLTSYVSLCRRLADDPGLLGAADLTVVVEDPWALRQIEEALRDREDAEFPERPSLGAAAARTFILGLARRVKWFGRMLRTWTAQRRSWAGARGRPPQEGVVIYSHLSARFLEGETGWVDPFLSGLEEELREAGAGTVRVTYPDTTGFEAELAKRKAYVVPLILHASLGDILRSLFAVPPRIRRAERVADVPIGILLRREWWHDFSRAGRCAFMLLHACARGFMRTGDWKALVFPWENQPQERMLLLAAQEAGVRTMGYQHTTVPSFQLPFFLGKGESAYAPLPDLILTSGEQPLEALAEGGIPRQRLRVGGTRRYRHFLENDTSALKKTGKDVLLMLPIDRFQSRPLLAALRRAFPGGGEGFDFLLRAHPSDPIDPASVGFPVADGGGPMGEALARCGAAVFTGSTAGLDALLAGHPVLRYRPDSLLDFDPCDMFGEDIFPTASDADLGEKLASLRRGDRSVPEEALRKTLRRVFSPLDRPAWIEGLGLSR